MRYLTSIFILGMAMTAFAETKPATLSGRTARALEASAKSPEDHRRLAEYYRAKAASETAQARQHEAEAEYYRVNPSPLAQKHPMIYGTYAHCHWLSERYAHDAEKSGARAERHEALAGRI